MVCGGCDNHKERAKKMNSVFKIIFWLEKKVLNALTLSVLHSACHVSKNVKMTQQDRT